MVENTKIDNTGSLGLCAGSSATCSVNNMNDEACSLAIEDLSPNNNTPTVEATEDDLINHAQALNEVLRNDSCEQYFLLNDRCEKKSSMVWLIMIVLNLISKIRRCTQNDNVI